MECKWKKDLAEHGSCAENMTSWRLGTCPSYADTYIEWCFEKRCQELKNGVDILTEWRDRKRQYISQLECTAFEYQHYSRHDVTHSISILEAIEMLLGKERVDLLSAGDLWMLLECAYMHDLGMNLNYKELLELWENNQEFKKYLENALAEDSGISQGAIKYKQLDNLLHDREKIEGISHLKDEAVLEWKESWPLELERELTVLVAEFIRKRHTQRVMQSDEKLDNRKDSVIPIRLYKVRALAASLHGENFETIISELEPCTKGFGNTRIHPRFAAAMLRIADLLDMENNRFNISAMEYFGKLPYYSMLHYEKHRAITHISICPRKIEAKAVSDDPEVCALTSSWFGLLDQEVRNLICFWNEIVPPDLVGCLLQTCECKVLLQKDSGKHIFNMKPGREFEVNRQKLLELMVGLGFYKSRLDFIREYLQNAIDATKMKLWRDIQSGAYTYSDNFNVHSVEREYDFTPFDIGNEIYNLYTIDLHIEIDAQTNKVSISIIDKGIGMEKSCIEVISKIGSGWRKREEYKEDLQKMPRWMKPTGGFGIGIQSAFMVTDEVEIITRAINEAEGRKIKLQTPKNRGQITEETVQNIREGTEVNIVLDLKWFLDWKNELALKKTNKNKNINYSGLSMYEQGIEPEKFSIEDCFDPENIQEYVVKLITSYIRYTIPNSPIPIRVSYTHKEVPNYLVIRGKAQPRNDYWKKQNADQIICQDIILNGLKYKCFYLMEYEQYKIILWDCTNHICCAFDSNEGGLTKKAIENVACFKNIRATDGIITQKAYGNYLGNKLIDFQGFYAEDILMIHRDEFKPEFDGDYYYKIFMEVYFLFMESVLEGNRTSRVQNDISNILNNSDSRIVRAFTLKQKLKATQDVLTSSDEWKSRRIFAEKFCFDGEEMFLNRERKMLNVETLVEDIINSLLPGDYSDEYSEYKNGIFAYVENVSEKYFGEDEKIHPRKYETWIEHRRNQLLGMEDVVQNCSQEELTDFAESWKLFDALERRGYILSDFETTRLLEDYEGYSKKIFSIEKGRPIALFYMQKEQYVMNEEEFMSLSYGKMEKGKVFEGKNTEYYPMLCVSKLPFNMRESKLSGFLISPIGQKEYNLLTKLYEGVTENRDSNIETSAISFEQFKKCIVEGDRYKTLIKWVHENQVSEKKISVKKIEEAYESYLYKIYEWKERTIQKEKGGKRTS